uniref:histone H1-like n=1 Tax=Pristiophorus japonicus TaxID=55135 RepID=UPI00398E32D5
MAPPAAAAQTRAPSKKKVVYSCSKPAGPKFGKQILKVVAEGSDRKGMSLAAIKKALAVKGVDVEKCGYQIRFSIKRNVTNGSLKQINATGASGSFKVAEMETPGKVGRKVKKPAAKKYPAKQTSTKKAPTAKKYSESTGWEEGIGKEAQEPQEGHRRKVEGGQKGGEINRQGHAQISKVEESSGEKVNKKGNF